MPALLDIAQYICRQHHCKQAFQLVKVNKAKSTLTLPYHRVLRVTIHSLDIDKMTTQYETT